MDDSKIIDLYWQRSEQAIDKIQKNSVPKISYRNLAQTSFDVVQYYR